MERHVALWSSYQPPRRVIDRVLCEVVARDSKAGHAPSLPGALKAGVALERSVILASPSIRLAPPLDAETALFAMARWLILTPTGTTTTTTAVDREAALGDQVGVRLMCRCALQCMWSYPMPREPDRVVYRFIEHDRLFVQGGVSTDANDDTFNAWFDHYAVMRYRVIENHKAWRIVAAELSRFKPAPRTGVEAARRWIDSRYARRTNAKPTPTLRALFAHAPPAWWEVTESGPQRPPKESYPQLFSTTGGLLFRAFAWTCAKILSLPNGTPVYRAVHQAFCEDASLSSLHALTLTLAASANK
jgi:hypothetical protein